MCQFEITDVYSLWHVIIPHFLKYPLFGYKNLVFIKFTHALSLLFPYVSKKKPASLIGKVLYLMSLVNPGTSRKTSEINRLMKTLNLNKEEIINSVKLEIVKHEKKFFSCSNIVNYDPLNIFLL